MTEATASTVRELRALLATMPDNAEVWLLEGAQPGIQILDVRSTDQFDLDEELAFITVNTLTPVYEDQQTMTTLHELRQVLADIACDIRARSPRVSARRVNVVCTQLADVKEVFIEDTEDGPIVVIDGPRLWNPNAERSDDNPIAGDDATKYRNKLAVLAVELDRIRIAGEEFPCDYLRGQAAALEFAQRLFGRYSPQSASATQTATDPDCPLCQMLDNEKTDRAGK